MGADSEEAEAGHPNRRRKPPGELIQLILNTGLNDAAAFVVELAELLWPEADPDADWSSDTLQDVDLLFERYGWHPLR